MPLIWKSFGDYEKEIHPAIVGISEYENATEVENTYSQLQNLLQTEIELKHCFDLIGKFRITKETESSFTPLELKEIKDIAIAIIHNAELLLLYNCRIADSDYRYFTLFNRSISHLDRYLKEGRILNEIDNILHGAKLVIEGHKRVIDSDYDFIIKLVEEIPEEIKEDFILSQNLFSVGFEETGLLVAGRGLEAVLRNIAKKRKLIFKNSISSKEIPLSEVPLYSLIESFYNLRWKGDNTRVIENETRTLMHYLREVRNKGAHTSKNKQFENQRSMAIVTSEVANKLWSKIAKRNYRFKDKTVTKSWSEFDP